MNLMRLRYALAAVLTIAIAGCSSDNDGKVDGGQKKDTSVTDDGGGMDTGGKDAGPRDTTTGPGTCDDNLLGCRCQPDNGQGQGSCIDPNHVCAVWNDAMDMPANVSTCIMSCANDNDCIGQLVGGHDDRPASRCLGGLCLEEQAADGTNCVYGAISGETTAGCAADSICVIGLDQLNYIGSCGKGCRTNNDCGTDFPFCNPQVLNSTTTPGICSRKQVGPGDPCSLEQIVQTCDTSSTPLGNPSGLRCFGITGLDVRDPDAPNEAMGFCLSQCDANPATNDELQGLYDDCSKHADPNYGDATCVQAFADDEDFGICSNNCDIFGDFCGNPGVFNQGQACLALAADGDPFAVCRAAVPPIITEYDFGGTPSGDCLAEVGGEFNCMANTFCIQDQTGTGLCIRGCTTDTSSTPGNQTGCEASTVGTSSCSDSTGSAAPDDMLGFCVPPGN